MRSFSGRQKKTKSIPMLFEVKKPKPIQTVKRVWFEKKMAKKFEKFVKSLFTKYLQNSVISTGQRTVCLKG